MPNEGRQNPNSNKWSIKDQASIKNRTAKTIALIAERLPEL